MTVAVSRSRAVAAFALGTLYFGYAFTQRVAPSVMTSELMRDFAVGGAALGALSAWYFYAYAGIQLPVGLLMDRFGPRRLMSLALAVCALASIGFAMSTNLVVAAIGRAMIGGAVAFGFVGTLTIAAYWFSPERFAFLAGVIQTVGMFGAVLGQAPLRELVEFAGWRGTVYALSGAALVLAVLIFTVVPEKPRQKRPGPAARKPLSGLKSVLTNPQSWMCAGAGFGLTAVMLAFAGLWAVPWLSSVHGFSKSEAAGIASTLFIGWAVTAPFWGWFSDHSGRRKPVIYFGTLLSITVLLLILVPSAPPGWYLTLMFFLSGVGGSTMTVIFSSVREVNAPENGATALGLMNMFVVGSGAVMQPLVGALLDFNWTGGMQDGARVYVTTTYTWALASLFLAQLTALVCTIFLRETHCRNRFAAT